MKAPIMSSTQPIQEIAALLRRLAVLRNEGEELIEKARILEERIERAIENIPNLEESRNLEFSGSAN